MTCLFLNGIAKKFCKLISGKTILLTGSTTIIPKMMKPFQKVIPFETRVWKFTERGIVQYRQKCADFSWIRFHEKKEIRLNAMKRLCNDFTEFFVFVRNFSWTEFFREIVLTSFFHTLHNFVCIVQNVR